MALFDDAFEKVAGLVRDFEASEDYYRSTKYQESELRKDFLDKFWKALGWDVDHHVQTNPREQEVKVERGSDSVSNRKADYAFYLAPDFQRPQFLVEAKKPSVILASKEFYFQTARYGYSTSTTVSVLTDFAEFHIIDCRRKPENVDAIVMYAGLKRYTYKDYLDRDKFGEIYWTFSHEAVQEGKLKAYRKSLPKPKGKTKQLKLIGDALAPVDDAFLAELDEHRRTLASEFRKSNPDLTPEQLTEAAQKVLDRLVFIRFLEDKMIEHEFILDTFGVKGSAWKRFILESRKLDKEYNGVVFKENIIDQTDFIPPNDDKFFDICEELNHQNSPYLFSYIPVEILGSIYERFLGKVVVFKGRGVALDRKPELRKAGGIYYTPKYIVDYIVENTVGKILEGKNPDEVSKLRFADIACGSGSFLVAIFDRIVRHLEAWYNAHPGKARDASCRKNEEGQWVLTLDQKRKVLRENVYGVDIDPQAVEVAQFSLFLKLLETETIATKQAALEFDKKHTILPDLSKNIQCGNSLVEHNISHLFPLTPDEEMRIKPFDFETRFKFSAEPGKFDAIVGNPPYVRIQILNEYKPQEVKYYGQEYRAAGKGNYDVYVLFVDRALELIRQNGEIGYIIPSKFTTMDYGMPLRTLISSEKNLRKYVNFGHEQVFRGATTYTCILFLNKESNAKVEIVTVKDFAQFQRAEDGLMSEVSGVRLNSGPWSFVSGPRAQMMEKLRNSHTPLGTLCEIFVGLQTSADDVYILDFIEERSRTFLLRSKALQKEVELEKALVHPLLSGKDIKRYHISKKRQYILFPYSVENEMPKLLPLNEITKFFPLIATYLQSNKRRLASREHSKFDDSQWYRFGRSQNLGIQERPKLAVPRLVERLGVGWDARGEYFLDNVDVGGVTIKSGVETVTPKYLMAILNSQLMRWYFPLVSTPFRGGFYSANRQYLSPIPIRTLELEKDKDQAQLQAIEDQVDQMLATKQRLATVRSDAERTQLEAKCAWLDHEIDKLVYQLYGLTEEEIKIVEEN